MKSRERYVVAGSSDYSEGKTDLTQEQVLLMEKISYVLNGYTHNYDNLHKNYAPDGIISVLKDQVKAKAESGSIDESERVQASQFIHALELNFSKSSR